MTTDKPLSATEKKALKQKSYALKPLVILGQKGLSEAVIAELETALVAHELVKIKLTGLGREDYANAMQKIAVQTGATPIARIGRVLTVYRKKLAG